MICTARQSAHKRLFQEQQFLYLLMQHELLRNSAKVATALTLLIINPMPAAPIPANDDERLAALRELLILDTPPEQRFDRLVQFAADEFDVPIALLTFVDRERQWFKSRIGLDACETDRDASICAHAIDSDDTLLIVDALSDPRFADNPMVIGAPFIRFYVGAPLQIEPGLRVGTLCLIDTQPRGFDAVDMSILGTLRDLVQEELRRPAEAR